MILSATLHSPSYSDDLPTLHHLLRHAPARIETLAMVRVQEQDSPASLRCRLKPLHAGCAWTARKAPTIRLRGAPDHFPGAIGINVEQTHPDSDEGGAISGHQRRACLAARFTYDRLKGTCGVA